MVNRVTCKGADYDVIVIGAGPAGCAAAIELASSGRSVLVVEKRMFPRPKVCGGCLSAPAVVRAKALLGSRCPLPGIATSRMTLSMGRYRVSCRPRGLAWMTPRGEFDACLADAARAAGAEIRFGEAARLEPDAGKCDVVIGKQRLRGEFILMASGLGALPDDLGVRQRGPAPDMVAQQWVQPAAAELPALGEVELHWLNGGYVGLATPEADHCVIALAVKTKELSGRSPLDMLRKLNPHAPLWKRISPDAPRSFAAKGTASFPWMPDQLALQNVLFIGDAAGYAEPFAGTGIHQALRSARCAVSAISAGDNVLTRYATSMGRHRRTLWRTRKLSSVLRFVAGCLPERLTLPFVRTGLAWGLERVHVRGIL